jgi:8-oxo-dGTP pyrophosphatase MutT (NUDIX family)/2'-5' RNA ligase
MIDLEELHSLAVADGRRPVVGALILDQRKRVFVHRRGPDRAFLPEGWDLVGGHVEAGETLLEALHREVAEETGWSVVGTPSLAFVGDWRTDRSDPSTARREFDFLVAVDGDLARPRLEWPKHTEFRWIGGDELILLDENEGRDDGLVRHLAELALRSAEPAGPAYAHATLFLGGAAAEPIEALRRRWDPALASQIGAHLTVAYPGETGPVGELIDRARRAASDCAPFTVRLGQVVRRAGAHDWVGVEVIDTDGGWARLRRLLVPDADARGDVAPHITIVHPRHSNLGVEAWEAVRSAELAATVSFDDVAVTAFDGRAWSTVDRVALTADPAMRSGPG